MEVIEIFGRKLIIVEDYTNTCKKCALSDICPFGLMPCKDANGNVNRRFEQIKELVEQEFVDKQWKPSDEQIKALKKTCDKHWEPNGLDPLYTLYLDLKKLKKE